MQDTRPVAAQDTETGLIRQGCLAPPLVCVSFWSTHRPQPDLLRWDDAKQAVAADFTQAAEGRRVIVGQNFAYDVGVYMAKWPDLIPLFFAAYDADGVRDTMLNEKILDLAQGQLGFHDTPDGKKKVWYSLDAIAQRRGRPPMDKGADGWRLRYIELINMPVADWPDRARDYAMRDAKDTGEIDAEQHRDAAELERKWGIKDILTPGYEQARAALALHLMSCRGMLTDPELVTKMQHALEAERDRLYATLKAADMINKTGGILQKPLREKIEAFALNVATSIWESGHECDVETLIERTPKGGVSIAAEHLNRIVMDDFGGAAGDPIFSTYVRYKKIEKTLNTYVAKLSMGFEHPIQPRVNSMLETGRTSMRGWVGQADFGGDKFKGFSWQTVPKQFPLPGFGTVHNCAIPRPGYEYVAADYSVAELRSFGQLLYDTFGGVSVFADLFREDPKADPHAHFAASLMDITPAEALALKAKGELTARKEAKIGNFSFAGGMGVRSFCARQAKTYYETDGIEGALFNFVRGQALRDGWLEHWQVEPYFDWVTEKTKWGPGQFRDADTPYALVRGGCRFTDGSNHGFQTKTARGALRAGWYLVRAMYAQPESPLFGSRLNNFIHDEWLSEVPKGTGKELTGPEISRIMVDAMQEVTPDVAAIVDYDVTERWTK